MNIKLSAQVREKNEKLASGVLPAVIYGYKLETESLKLNYNEFLKVFIEAGETNLINLSIDGKENIPVLVKAIQKHPVKEHLLHVDLFRVNMEEVVKVSIPLEFINEENSKALKDLGGVFISSITELNAECLPKDLVDHIKVDISVLNELGDFINLNDLVLPSGIKLAHESNDLVCMAEAPKKMAEPVVSTDEVVEKAKEEGEGAEASKEEAKEEEKRD